MNKTKIKNIILIFLVSLCGMYFIINYMNSGVEEDFFTDLYLYLWNGNLNILFFLIFLVIFHEVCVMDSYKKIYNNFARLIITRIGYKGFYKKEFKDICIKSFYYYYLLHIILIIFCIFKYGFMTSTNLGLFKYHIFVNDPIIDLILFIIISSLGVAIFNCFIFSLSTFIKNIYLYRFIPLVLLFVTILFSTVFSTFIQNIFGYDIFIKTLGQTFMITSLIQPGMGFMMLGFLNFGLAASVFIIISAILIKISINKRMKFDE